MKNQKHLCFSSIHFIYSFQESSIQLSLTVSLLLLFLPHYQLEARHFLVARLQQVGDWWGNSEELSQSIKFLNLGQKRATLQGSFDVFLNVYGIVHFVSKEKFFPWEGKFELVRNLFSFFVFQLLFGLENQFKCVSYCLLVVCNVEMCVPSINCLHQKIVKVECFVVRFKISCA